MQNQEITKFEFILTLEKNIVIQRFFNVMNYNPESKNSLDLYYCVTNICDEISKELKTKTIEYMCENEDYYFDLFDENESIEIKEEYFLLQIKHNEEVIASTVAARSII